MRSTPCAPANLISRQLADPSQIRGAAGRTLYDYWNDKRGDRPFPAWPEIRLMDLWPIAAHLMVKDVIDGGADFFNRYWGSQLTEMLGIEGTGKTSTQLYGAGHRANFLNFRRVVESARPVLSYRRLTFVDDRDHVTYEVVHLPLGPDGGPVEHIVTAFDFDCDLRDVLGG